MKKILVYSFVFILAILFGFMCSRAEDKALKIKPEQTLEIAKLQRDLVVIQKRRAEILANYFNADNQLRGQEETKFQVLQQAIKDIGCEFDIEKLECVASPKKSK
jgi:hypothetical protein